MDAEVKQYINSIDDAQVVDDTITLIDIMKRISGSEPKLWNVGTLGFGSYHYKYDSKREGDNFVIGFYPRKGKLTIYMMDGTARHSAMLAKLGKHTTTGYCIYIKRLSDVDMPILERIIAQSYEFITSLSLNGPIDRILWQTEE